MVANSSLALISREFLRKHRVYRYRMKKIQDMTDDECIAACHTFYEEQGLKAEFLAFREAQEEALVFCPRLDRHLAPGWIGTSPPASAKAASIAHSEKTKYEKHIAAFVLGAFPAGALNGGLHERATLVRALPHKPGESIIPRPFGAPPRKRGRKRTPSSVTACGGATFPGGEGTELLYGFFVYISDKMC